MCCGKDGGKVYVTGIHRYYKRIVTAFTVPCGSYIYMSQVAVSVLIPFVISVLHDILVTEMSDKIS